jgi:hypothetical protein
MPRTGASSSAPAGQTFFFTLPIGIIAAT